MNAELDRRVEQVFLQQPYPPTPGGLFPGHGFGVYHLPVVSMRHRYVAAV
jgi:hypothetical protein